MSEANAIKAMKPASLAGRFLEISELLPAGPEPGPIAPRLEEARERIAEIAAEVEARGLPDVSRAVGRLGVLIELWECLSADRPESAGELGLFCIKAATRLARVEPEDPEAEDIARWILDLSSSSWGDYLSLLDSSFDPAEPPMLSEPPEVEAEDERPRIDARALLSLFTGTAEVPEEEPREAIPPPRPVRPQVPVEPAVAPRQTATPPAAPIRSPGREPASGPTPLNLALPTLPPRVELDDEIRQAFLADSTELFERIEPLVLGLGRAEDESEALHELGRCLHTLKGAAGSVGIGDLASLVHALEEHVEAAGKQPSRELIDLLLRVLGYLDGLLDWLRTGRVGRPEEPPAGPADPPEPSPEVPVHQPSAGSSQTTPSGTSPDGLVRIPSARLDDLIDLVSELIAKRRLWSTHAESIKSIATMARNCRQRMTAVLDRLHEAGLGRDGTPRAVQVGADLPGQLRRLGELADDLAVLADAARSAGDPLADHGGMLARLTIQLWDDLQAIRIVPIRGLFQRLIRVAHDAARVEGRQVEVVLSGEETGVDRAVLDKAFEPLLHVVRNAVGHGIESPDDRTRAGKPAAGKISLEAIREGNTLAIAVTDDGRGLNHEAIAAKARRLGLLGPDETPTRDRLNNLIFHPGFSTREQASTISGRGVGMDVVAREIGLLKGTIDLQTEQGRGTRLVVRLPARLALETTMIVRVDGQAFAIPVAQIESVSSLEADGSGTDRAAGTPSMATRGLKHPVVSAREILEIDECTPPSWPRLLVARAGGGPIGLLVDAIEGTEELVIKPLCSLLAGHPLISGTSQSESGEVISILNLSGLRRWAGDCPSRLGPADLPGANREGSIAGPAVLIVDDSISVRRVVARQLRAMGMQVDEVSDGLEALGRLKNNAYGLVVTDLEMPRLDGFGLLAEMRRGGPLAGIPVIVASTRVDPETRQRVDALGARAFLSKPVDPSALAAAVGPLFDRAAG